MANHIIIGGDWDLLLEQYMNAQACAIEMQGMTTVQQAGRSKKREGVDCVTGTRVKART